MFIVLIYNFTLTTNIWFEWKKYTNWNSCLIDSLVINASGHGYGNQKDQKHEQWKYHAVVFPAR